MDVKPSDLAPLAVSPVRAAELIGVGRTAVFGLMRDGSLPFFKRGRRTLIATADLRKWVEERAAEARKVHAA